MRYQRPIQKNDAMTTPQARTQLKMLLASARSLDGLTAETLFRTHKVPLKEIAYELQMARQKREASSI